MTDFARVYGGALYELENEAGNAAATFAELKQLDEIFRENPDFTKLLSDRGVSKEERLSIAQDVLGAQASRNVMNFIKILCERGAMQEFSSCVQVFRVRHYEDAGILEAQAWCAEAMGAQLQARLVQKLCAVTGKQVLLTVKIDPDLVGGIRLEMDGKRFDNTVQSRIESFRQALIQTIE